MRFRYDAGQVGDDRVSSVQYLKLEVGRQAPVALGCDHPQLRVETPLTPAQRKVLDDDLKAD